MTIDMRQFYPVFFEEADELLSEMETLLVQLNLSAPDPEQLNAIFRAAHSVKGGAATFGMTEITEVTHALEAVLDRLRKGALALDQQQVDLFLSANDLLKTLIAARKRDEVAEDVAAGAILASLRALGQDSPVAALAASRTLKIVLPILTPSQTEGLCAELALLGACSASTQGQTTVVALTTAATEQAIREICEFVVEAEAVDVQDEASAAGGDDSPPVAAEEDGEQGFGFFKPVARVPAAPAGSAGAHDATPGTTAGRQFKRRASDRVPRQQEGASIRVSVEKVDQLINMVGELVIARAMVEQRIADLDPVVHEGILSSVSQLSRNTRDLQEAVMSIRMMPIEMVFSRFPRMVRDLGTSLGKKIELVTQGAGTELDKGLIERIVDPLMHLVRNSVDHGLETPDERVAAGKNPIGRISLSAGHVGGHIVIEVTDDGKGLSRNKILGKARSMGLAAPDTLSDQEVWQLIFAPGFSTAEEVTDISGRGVGMDVVKKNIASMNGTIEVKSAPNFGTSIVISLPLTLAILDGMSVRVTDEVYIVPLNYVLESLQPGPGDVRQIGGKGVLIKVRDEYLPLVSLHAVFGTGPAKPVAGSGIVVVMECDGRKAAFVVDDLIGQHQVVVKNIESNYKRIPGISGATIMGDGGVALILDVPALLRTYSLGADGRAALAEEGIHEQP